MITDSHKKTVLDLFKEQYKDKLFEVSIPPKGGFLVSTKIGQALTKILGSRRAASTIAGAAVGFSFDEAYHLLHGVWKRIDDYIEGQTVDLKKLDAYSAKVSKHADARTKAMIKDLAIAIEDHNWIKVAKIQKHLLDYGKKIGYDYDENLHELHTKTLASYTLKAIKDGQNRAAAVEKLIKQSTNNNFKYSHAIDHGLDLANKLPIRNKGIDRALKKLRDRGLIDEDGGAAGGLGGGAPTNNVGSGHIAGAAGDPPGPKAKLFKKIITRRKPIGESLRHGNYEMVGITFDPKPVMHYAAVNKHGKYLHTTSKKMAIRHAHSGGKRRKG